MPFDHVPIDPDRAGYGHRKNQGLLEAVKSKLGLVPNMVRAMANSPAALNAYVQFSGALAGGSLSARNREQIALAVGQVNECNYCRFRRQRLGQDGRLTPDQIRDSRQGTAADGKTDALSTLRPQTGRDPGAGVRRGCGRGAAGRLHRR